MSRKLGHAPCVAAAIEAGPDEDPETIPGDVLVDQSRPQADDVRVVVRAREPSRFRIVAYGGTDRTETIGDHAHADAGAADQDATVGLARRDGACDVLGVIGIVDGLGVVGTKVLDGAIHARKLGLEDRLEADAIMIRGYRHSKRHVRDAPQPTPMSGCVAYASDARQT